MQVIAIDHSGIVVRLSIYIRIYNRVSVRLDIDQEQIRRNKSTATHLPLKWFSNQARHDL